MYDYTRKHIFQRDFIYLFILDRGEGREEEKHQCVVASRAPSTVDLTQTTTQSCALTGNRTSDPLVHRLALNPLSHTSQGQKTHFWHGYNYLCSHYLGFFFGLAQGR